MTESTASATERVGRYQLLEPIGSGPTGAVWRAKVFGVAGFERQFAVKRFLPEVTSTPPAAQALSAGARAYGSLEHPRIARMTEFGVAQGQTFTAVELVTGMDAMRLAAEARAAGVTLAAGGVLALVSQVARAIGYAHGRGISHLGLAPTNVIVTPEGDVKVTDFAILAATLPPKPADSPRLALRIAYLAPEQLAAEATSAATDVFALGVLAYELVTGQRTFRGDTPQQVAQAIMAGPPAEPALPRPIVRVLQRCLARSPFERFPDARAFADALDAALRVAPVPGSRKDLGAHVKATLERLAEMRDNQLSGVLALHIGTGPTPRFDPAELAPGLGASGRDARDARDLGDLHGDPKTSEYVRPDLAVPGPAPLVAPAREGNEYGGATQPDLPRPMTTMPGLAPPPIPVPRSIPAIPPLRRPNSPSEGARVGNRIANEVASVPSIPAHAPPVAAHAPAAASEDVSSLAADLAALGDEIPAFFDEPATHLDRPSDATIPRQRTMLDAHTEPGVGIRPTSPALPPPPTRDMQTDELSPILADRLGVASTKPTGEIAPLVKDAYHADALAEFPDEVRSSSYTAAAVAAAPARPATHSIPSPAAPNPQAPLRLPSERSDLRVRPRRWPWIAVGLLTLGVIGAVSYFVLETLADDGELPVVAVADAHAVVAVAKPDAAAAVAAKLDAAAVTIAHADAAVALAKPDAQVAVDAAVVAPAPADAAVAAPPADARTATPTPTPTPTPGDKLSITSTPPGAHVFLDGADQGVTPLTLPGSAGRHTAVLLLPGHDLYVAEVDGHGAFAIPLKDVTPSTGPAGIKVLKCAANRYYVSVDGKPTGQLCPTERIACEVGAHTVETYDAVTGAHRKWDIQVTDTRLSFRVRVE